MSPFTSKIEFLDTWKHIQAL